MRICNLCDENVIGDEFHYILECYYFNNVLKKYIDDCYRKRPTIIKLGELMSIKTKLNLQIKLNSLSLLIKLCVPQAKSISFSIVYVPY